ncbi:MAG: DUF1028 domain-containing protein [Trueperaceae bacterium]
MKPITTFSIVARDAATGDFGVAVASKFLAVGSAVSCAKAKLGAVATQSYANTSYGPRTLAGLEAGLTLESIHGAFAATDDGHAQRQYGLVDAQGKSITFTGSDCHPWAGGVAKANLAIQGNILAGPHVIERMLETFEASTLPFPEKLLAALQAGDDVGGDKRGKQSAALLVVREKGGYGGFDDRYLDLRVDDHSTPIPELSRLLSLHHLYFDKPEANNILAIRDEIAERLSQVLVKAGFLKTLQPWHETSEKALRDLAGVENVEERMLEPGLVDRVVLEHLETLYK